MSPRPGPCDGVRVGRVRPPADDAAPTVVASDSSVASDSTAATLWASAATGLRGRAAAVAWFDGASDSGDEDDSDAPPPAAPVVIDVDAPPPPTSFDRPIVIDDDAVPAATPSPPAAKELPWWAEPLPAPIFDTPAERRAARAFTTRTRGTATQRVKRRAPAPAAAPRSRFKRTTRVPRAVAAPAAAPADPFAVGATVELHGLVSNPSANGRRVVIVQTPPDVAARGRISVNLDGNVRAVKRENVRAVPGGVGAAPSTAAMAWLTPGFLSMRLHGEWSDESRGIYPLGLVVRVVRGSGASVL